MSLRALLDRTAFTSDDELMELMVAKQLGMIPITTRAEIRTFVVRALTGGHRHRTSGRTSRLANQHVNVPGTTS